MDQESIYLCSYIVTIWLILLAGQRSGCWTSFVFQDFTTRWCWMTVCAVSVFLWRHILFLLTFLQIRFASVSFCRYRAILGTASLWRWRSLPGRSLGTRMWVCPLAFPSSTAAWCCRARLDSCQASASCSFAPAAVWPLGWTSLSNTEAVVQYCDTHVHS